MSFDLSTEEIIIGRTEHDIKKYGKKGTGYLAKVVMSSGENPVLGRKVLVDLSKPHVVLITGKRGCLTEDTFIFTNKGYKKIKDYTKKNKILAYNKEKKNFEWETANLLAYDTSEKEDMFEFEFKDGQKLITTSEHPLLIKRNNKTDWITANKIKKSDLILTAYDLPKLKTKDKYSLRVARLLGFIIADGTMHVKKGIFKDSKGYVYNGTKARIRITNNDIEVLNQAKEDLDKEFKIKCRIDKRKTENCSDVITEQQKIIKFFNDLGINIGKKNSIVRIPEVVWQSSNKFKSEFIKALFSCDGYCAKEGIRLNYYSNSKELIKDLNLLLGHFGIQSTLRPKKVTCNGKKFVSYELEISDYISLMNYKKEIGFFQELKKERLAKRKFNKVKQRKSTEYLNNKLFYQKIKSIKKVKGIKKVYDLEVPKNHSFIANGIISHNSGKSYTMSTFLEGFNELPPDLRNRMGILVIDTVGIFWSMKMPNSEESQMLYDWGLKPEGLANMRVLVPAGKYDFYKKNNLPVDGAFNIKTADVSAMEWLSMFHLNWSDIESAILLEAIEKLHKTFGTYYGLPEIYSVIDSLENYELQDRLSLKNRFKLADSWGIFSKEGSSIVDIAKPGFITVIDVSTYGQVLGMENVREIIVAILGKRLFEERELERKKEEITLIEGGEKKSDMPMIWMLIDEAHMFMPKDRSSMALDVLLEWVRVGRQPGLSLLLATQRPERLHPDAISQCDLFISMRLTAKMDIDSVGALRPSYLHEDMDKFYATLPRAKGYALILDDNSEKLWMVKIRPRTTWDAGKTASAFKK